MGKIEKTGRDCEDWWVEDMATFIIMTTAKSCDKRNLKKQNNIDKIVFSFRDILNRQAALFRGLILVH